MNIKDLTRPPREVPFLLKAKVIFGGVGNQFGWLFFGFGMIFFWVFVMNSTLFSSFSFSGKLSYATGIIQDSQATSMSENDERIYANYYKFTASDGKEYRDVSYARDIDYNKGKKVKVEYVKNNPFISRIKGMRREPFGAFVAFIIIFPFVGLIAIFFGIKKGIKANYLLENGMMTYGIMKSKSETNTEVNHQRVYKFVYEFNDESGYSHEVVVRTHKTDVVGDEDRERILYLPSQPEYAVLIDDLPGKPEIDGRGDFISPGLSAFPSFIIPGISIFGHGLYIYFKYFK